MTIFKNIKFYIQRTFYRKKQFRFIYHHLGLGDHIILQGLIRHLINKEINHIYVLFVKKRNYTSVQFMFKDLANIKYFVVDSDEDVVDFMKSINDENLIKIGFNNVTPDFDICFYKQMKVDFTERFRIYSSLRNTDIELKLFNKLKLNNKKYIFIHDDKSRNYIIDETKLSISDNILIIRPHITNTIFDWCMVLENATEIHCICSSFKALVDSIQPLKPKLYYYHTLPNSNIPRNETYTSSILKWEII